MKHATILAAMAIAASQILLTQPGAAQQDAGVMAAQQAAMQAQQQAIQQANQQAMDAAQRANQQAMQDSIQAASSPMPPRQRPALPRVPSGPIPAQIATAKSVFVTSLGAAPNSPMDAAVAYDQFVADLAAWGHYTMALSPADAELIFELREIAPLTSVDGTDGTVDSYSSPTFVLNIRDARTNVVLWTVVSPIEVAGRKAKREQWLALSVHNVVSRVKVLTRTPLTEAETTDLTAYPYPHAARTALLLTVGATAIAAGISVALFKHAESDAKNQQDQFCKANNIPLSMCAGG